VPGSRGIKLGQSLTASCLVKEESHVPYPTDFKPSWASAEIMLEEMPFLSSPNDREEEIMQIRVQRA